MPSWNATHGLWQNYCIIIPHVKSHFKASFVAVIASAVRM